MHARDSGPGVGGARDVDLLAIGETMALVAPQRAERLEAAEDFHVTAGGAESNVACHLAAAGRRTAWFSALGEDALGRRVRAHVASAGVDVSRVQLDPEAPTGLYLKDPGHGVAYYRRGSAASRLGPADLERVDWARVRILHLSGITLALSASCRALVHTAIRAAHAHGAIVSLDVNHRPALWSGREEAAATILAAAEQADVVLTGRDEAQGLWRTTTADDVRAVFPQVRHLVVKDAEVEAVEFTADGGAADGGAVDERTAVPTPKIEVVEAVGAGDAFAAGWIDGLLDGAPAAERLSRGHARAALALTSTHDMPAPVAAQPEGAPTA